MKEYLQQALKFSGMLNQFRLVERMMRVNGVKPLRQENDVEHSYQLAMLAWYIASSRKLDMDTNLIVKYALVHDLVEVYAGDTYVFSQDKAHMESKEERERQAMERLCEEFSEFPDLHETILNYEERKDRESRFVYALDKIQPVINYYLDDGKSYEDVDVSIDMILETRAKKVEISPEAKEYFDEILPLLYEKEDILFTKKSKPRKQ
jgi:putative hydrolase of HD superfamily